MLHLIFPSPAVAICACERPLFVRMRSHRDAAGPGSSVTTPSVSTAPTSHLTPPSLTGYSLNIIVLKSLGGISCLLVYTHLRANNLVLHKLLVSQVCVCSQLVHPVLHVCESVSTALEAR
jgi:hypothetical protein